LYSGFSVNYEDADLFADWVGVLGFNMNFRSNCGGEISVDMGRSRDLSVEYTSWEVNLSSWFQITPRWSADFSANAGRSYNFQRNYLARYGYGQGDLEWKPASFLTVGTSLGAFIEGNPEGSIEEITYNARPYVSLTPMNDLNIRLYVDNTYLRSSQQLEQVLYGLLISYNFLPKSWVYLAVNDVEERREVLGMAGEIVARRLETASRAAVTKIKYLYYL
jgi:hypothetical protein